MIGWPSVCSRSWPMMRARASVADPAPKGMTNLMGFDGDACACASACDSNSSAASAAITTLRIGILPVYFLFILLVKRVPLLQRRAYPHDVTLRDLDSAGPARVESEQL